MKRYVPLILLLLTLLSCNRTKEMDPAFIEGEGICLQVDGKTVFRYDPLTCQLGYSAEKREYRAFTDDMSAYYVLTCRSLPGKVGDTVTGELEWAKEGQSIHKKSGLKLNVKKIGDDGRIWLWCSKEGIAIIVCTLQK